MDWGSLCAKYELMFDSTSSAPGRCQADASPSVLIPPIEGWAAAAAADGEGRKSVVEHVPGIGVQSIDGSHVSLVEAEERGGSRVLQQGMHGRFKMVETLYDTFYLC